MDPKPSTSFIWKNEPRESKKRFLAYVIDGNLKNIDKSMIHLAFKLGLEEGKNGPFCMDFYGPRAIKSRKPFWTYITAAN